MPDSKASVNAREFLETWPLYKTLAYDKSFPIPKTISRHCERCDRDSTWACRGNFSQLYNVVLLWFRCNLCDVASVVYTVCRIDDTVTKIGQYPRHSSAVPRNFAKRLGNDAEVYRKALVCRTQGYGLAALSYFRRLVESQADALIEVVADLAAVHGLDEGEAAKIRLAKQEANCANRLRKAAEVLPDSLKPGGVNPLGILVEVLSRPVNNSNEKECLELADELREVFDHVFGRLHVQAEDQRRFVASAKRLTGKQLHPKP